MNGIVITWAQLLYISLILVLFYVAELLLFMRKASVQRAVGLDPLEADSLRNEMAQLRFEIDVVETALGNAPNQWHLATFKPKADASARSGFLAFVPFARSLAVPATLATSQTLNPMFCPWTGFECMKFHCQVSCLVVGAFNERPRVLKISSRRRN